MSSFRKHFGNKKAGRDHGSLPDRSRSRPPQPPPAEYAGPSPSQKHGNNNNGSTYPSEIQHGIDSVRKFVAARLATPCHKCKKPVIREPPAKNFKVKAWMKRWSEAARGRPENANLLCAAECKGCARALTCLGCGKEPKKTSSSSTSSSSGAAQAHEVHGHYLAWCCRDGRLFAIWVMLARFDQVELRTLSGGGGGGGGGGSSGGSGRSMGVSRFMGGRQSSQKGTGYASSSPFFFDSPWDMANDQINRPLEFETSDGRTDEFTQLVLALVTVMIPARNNRNLPAELRGMLQLGYAIDKVADLLRNDSLDDVTSRAELYRAILRFVHRLGGHPELRGLVQVERHYKQRSVGLEAMTAGGGGGDVGLMLGDTIPSVAERLKQLAKQSDVVLGTEECDDLTTRSGKALIDMCQEIDKIYAEIATEGEEQEAQKQQRPGSGAVSPEDAWTAYHQKHCVTRSDAIIDPRVFAFYDAAVALSYSNPGRMKRMVTELASMATSLPPGIFVKVGESRPDVMKCLIMGPPDSPYGYGLFDFDLYCPDQYPHVPPTMRCPTGTGRRLNPNLHTDGEVCLSLLGTFHGDAASQWQPGKSTILSVLTSIQAMIFCEDPFRNQPGAGTITGSDFEHQAKLYSQQVQSDTIRYGILEWIEVPQLRNGVWAKVIRAHFAINRDRILANVAKWSRGNRYMQGFDAVGKVGWALDHLQAEGRR